MLENKYNAPIAFALQIFSQFNYARGTLDKARGPYPCKVQI